MASKDVELIKATAANRWIDILVALGGVSRDILDGKHHPCPRCEGFDRFRFIDAEAGACFCNQCFNKKNSDGLAALQWLTGKKFTEVKNAVKEFLGLRSTKEADPDKDLEFKDWSSQLVAHFLAAKPGVTEEAIQATGGRLATYKRSYSVIAWPIIGETLDLDRPVGWVLANVLGGTLPKFSPKGEILGQTKFKVAYGSKPGLIGLHAIERLKTPGMVDVVWKVEGISDLLALYSAMPAGARDRQVVVTNAMGAGERPRWMAGLLAAYVAHVIHDADRPGRAGATTWVAEIAVQGGTVRHVALPYEVMADHGKDLRDWLTDGHDWADLVALAEQAVITTPVKTTTGEIDYSQAKYPIQELILKKLQIEVLYELEDGRIRVFSWLLRKSSMIQQIDRLKKEKLIQICGGPAKTHVSSDPDGEETWSMTDVREAIALIAASRRGEDKERGVGVWQVPVDEDQVEDAILLVGNTEAARWNGDGNLHRVTIPRVDDLVLDFGAGGRDWYKFDVVARYLESAKNLEWRDGVITTTCKLFEKWNWRHNDIDPTLVTGLILASWVQLVWEWRPLVSITGESSCGKSYLFDAIGGNGFRQGLFGRLAFKSGKSTEAGVRQGIGNTARIALLDEFEQSPHRDRIFEMLRLSTRGETVVQGTSGGKGREFALRHLVWIASTESGMQRQPDLNRFIQLDLLEAKPGEFGKLRLPESRELLDLGQKLLAVAVWSVLKAKQLAVELKSQHIPGIDARVVESYSVPAAMLGVALDYPIQKTERFLRSLLAGVDRSEQGVKDHLELLDAIITSQIFLKAKEGNRTVGQILESESLSYEYSEDLESHGIKRINDGLIFVANSVVGRKLLKGTPWEKQRIKQLLIRIHGAKQANRRIGGRVLRGVDVPLEPDTATDEVETRDTY